MIGFLSKLQPKSLEGLLETDWSETETGSDSTSLKVCHNRRIKQHKVFEDLAARGKTSVDWFFGFKLHLVVNDRGELLNIVLTPGNPKIGCVAKISK